MTTNYKNNTVKGGNVMQHPKNNVPLNGICYTWHIFTELGTKSQNHKKQIPRYSSLHLEEGFSQLTIHTNQELVSVKVCAMNGNY